MRQCVTIGCFNTTEPDQSLCPVCKLPGVSPTPKQHHPAVTELLSFFSYAHLPPKLAAVSKPFCDLAVQVASRPHTTSPRQMTKCLDALLEAKDCAVRAVLHEKVRHD